MQHPLQPRGGAPPQLLDWLLWKQRHLPGSRHCQSGHLLPTGRKKKRDSYLNFLHIWQSQCREQRERAQPRQGLRAELSNAEGDGGVNKHQGGALGAQHAPAGPHPIDCQDPGLVLQREGGGRGSWADSPCHRRSCLRPFKQTTLIVLAI